MTATLGEVADFINGFAFKPEDWEETGLPIIRIQNLTDASKPINRTTHKVPDKFRVRKGELLVSWYATLGVFTWDRTDEALVNQHIFRVVPSDKIDTSFLRHMLSGALEAMQRHLHGATMQHVNRGEFLSTEIPLPTLPEQRRIAAILDHADALRAKRRQLLVHLDSLTQSIFNDMFKGTDAIATVGDVAQIQGGLQVSSKRAGLPIEVPYLRVANVHRGRLDLSEVKTLHATPAEIGRTTLDAGDLLFVEGHANPLEIGRVAVWSGTILGCVHQNHLIRARLNPSQMLPIFASAWLNSERGAAHFRRAGKTTSGLNTISASTVRSAPLLCPPMVLQHKFATRAGSIDSLRSSVKRTLAADDELFASLQSRAFHGEV